MIVQCAFSLVRIWRCATMHKKKNRCSVHSGVMNIWLSHLQQESTLVLLFLIWLQILSRKQWKKICFCLCLFLPVSEASSCSQIRTAQAVREEFGEDSTRSSGISKWASINLKNSERDVQKTMQNQGTKLDVPITTITSAGVDIPWISPQNWLKFLLKNGLWHRLAGLDYEEKHLSPMVWTHFWEKFRTIHPHFSLFDHDYDLSKVAAFFIHGDEGRTLKRHAIMITTLQSALGFGFGEKRLKVPFPYAYKLLVNYAGHTMTTRFITSAVPKKYYETHPEVFHGVMEQLAICLRDLADQGVVCPLTGERYRICVIGCKGDLPYLQKCGNLVRAFNTGVKRGKEAKKPKGVCHLCLGGTDDKYPVEEIQTKTPAWLETVAVRLPWNNTPAFIRHMHCDLEDQATFYITDLWHNYHLGVGKAFVSSVVQLCLNFVPAPNLDAKWVWLTHHYRNFCRSVSLQPHITKLTGYTFSYGDKTGAMGTWSKGALTTNFCKWIAVLLAELSGDRDGHLQECLVATKGMNALFSCLFNSPLLLSSNEGFYVANLGFHFLDIYGKLARVCFDARKPFLFPLYTKLHMLHHAWIQIWQDCSNHGFAFNPLWTACQQDEDAIGRVSRISRRVSIRATMIRTMERYLVLAHTAWNDAGMIRAWRIARDLQKKEDKEAPEVV